jgi:hypothetical protein
MLRRICSSSLVDENLVLLPDGQVFDVCVRLSVIRHAPPNCPMSIYQIAVTAPGPFRHGPSRWPTCSTQLHSRRLQRWRPSSHRVCTCGCRHLHVHRSIHAYRIGDTGNSPINCFSELHIGMHNLYPVSQINTQPSIQCPKNDADISKLGMSSEACGQL